MKKVSFAMTLSALCFAGCGDDATDPAGTNIAALFPASDVVSGWQADAGGVQVSPDTDAVLGAVNGDAEVFIEHGLTQLARLTYTKGAENAKVRIWQMEDAAACAKLFTALAQNGLYSPFTWEDVAVGEAGKVANASGKWWGYARKGAYEFEAKIGSDDPAARTATLDFLKAIAANIK